MEKLISRGEDLLYTLETLDTDVIQELVDHVSSMRDQLDEAYEEYHVHIKQLENSVHVAEDRYAQSERERIQLLTIIKNLQNGMDI